jgi:hypothetical protein
LAFPVLKLLVLLVVELISKVPEMFVSYVVKKKLHLIFVKTMTIWDYRGGSKFFNGGHIIVMECVFYSILKVICSKLPVA